ncbi:MAG: hypothetical protein J6N21_01410 [Butyrivibrio sp.]|nr:hypothetical protein [Butyrivibrio sp.]
MNFIPLKISLDEACVQDFIKRYHFNKDDEKEIIRLSRQLLPRVHAQFHYVLEEADLESEWDEKSPAKKALVVLTLGQAFDEYQDSFLKKDDIHKAYIMDCLGIELMSLAYEEIDKKLLEITGLNPGDYLFVGDTHLPLSNLPGIMAKLGQKQVIFNEAYVLLPKKSVVFSVPLYEEKIIKHNKCELCGAKNCKLRRA